MDATVVDDEGGRADVEIRLDARSQQGQDMGATVIRRGPRGKRAPLLPTSGDEGKSATRESEIFFHSEVPPLSRLKEPSTLQVYHKVINGELTSLNSNTHELGGNPHRYRVSVEYI